MSQCNILIIALKQQLKNTKKTYADIADYLQLSESTIKRLFNSNSLSINRLEKICRFIGIELIDLMQIANQKIQRVNQLTHAQEQTLIDNEKLLLVMVAVLNGMKFAEILKQYTFTEAECYQCFKQLEALELIELLPFNQFKILVANDFSWIPGGPIEKFFNLNLRHDFFATDFKEHDELFMCLNGMLTVDNNALLQKKLQQVKKIFHDFHHDSINTGLAHAQSSALIIALRPWIPAIFNKFKR